MVPESEFWQTYISMPPSLADSEMPAESAGAHPHAPSQNAAAGSFRPIKEIGGAAGPEPTRFGDWEKKGRCIDF